MGVFLSLHLVVLTFQRTNKALAHSLINSIRIEEQIKQSQFNAV